MSGLRLIFKWRGDAYPAHVLYIPSYHTALDSLAIVCEIFWKMTKSESSWDHLNPKQYSQQDWRNHPCIVVLSKYTKTHTQKHTHTNTHTHTHTHTHTLCRWALVKCSGQDLVNTHGKTVGRKNKTLIIWAEWNCSCCSLFRDKPESTLYWQDVSNE